MRETKFQALYDNQIFAYEKLTEFGWEWMVLGQNPENTERWVKGTLLNSDKLIRRQFTCSHDKNGKEIYNGDIVKRIITDYDKLNSDDTDYDDIDWSNVPKKTEISFIEYRNNGFWVASESFGYEGEGLWEWNEMEVIGNIYANKDLLE